MNDFLNAFVGKKMAVSTGGALDESTVEILAVEDGFVKARHVVVLPWDEWFNRPFWISAASIRSLRTVGERELKAEKILSAALLVAASTIVAWLVMAVVWGAR